MYQTQMTFIITFSMIQIIAAIIKQKLKLILREFTNQVVCHSILEPLKIESNLQIH